MTIFQNLKNIFSRPLYTCLFIFLIILFGLLWYFFTDFALMKGNYTSTRYYSDIVISWINIIIFSLFIVAWIFRAWSFGNTGKSENLGFLGGIVAILISGSLCCGTSLLLVFGGTTIIAFISEFLPFRGMEIKILSVIILFISLFVLLKNLLVCKTNIKKSQK